MPTSSYQALVQQALEAPRGGWDFSWLQGRVDGGELTWRYDERVRAMIATVGSLLDVDTGGGEFLASLAPLPARTVATEGWAPNVAVARQRLEPLGVQVRQSEDGRLPAADGEFDLVVNRHGHVNAAETRRVLVPGGRLITQQVGSDNLSELNEALGAPTPASAPHWTLAAALDCLERAGLRILDTREEMPAVTFRDIGAVVFQLRAVPWQVPDFDVQRYEAPLCALHERMRIENGFTAREHRFLIEAQVDADAGRVAWRSSAFAP